MFSASSCFWPIFMPRRTTFSVQWDFVPPISKQVISELLIVRFHWKKWKFKYDVFALQYQSLLLIETIARNEWRSGTATQPRHISRWRLAGNSMIKINRLEWTIYRELSNLSCWCRQKLRKTLIWDWYCCTAELSFMKTLSLSSS